MPPLRRPLGHVVPFLACLFCFVTRLSAQAPQGCASPEHRQFDFWIGDWSVTTPQGDLAGTNRIERTLQGCVLVENWVGSKGGAGNSFNLWTAADGKWHQVWVDDSGNMLALSGGMQGSSMVLTGTHPAPSRPSVTVTERITWTPLDGGKVRQFWESSTDGGTTWASQFDGIYTRTR